MRRWLHLAAPALLVGALLVAATLVVGSTVNGASRWLVLGPVQIQPSELIKPFIVLQGAVIFSHWRRIALDQKLLWIAIFGVVILLILKQPNLSTAALLGLLLWLMALAAGPVPAAAAGGGSQRRPAGHGQHPGQPVPAQPGHLLHRSLARAQGDGYQLVQSLLAIGSGGVLGAGFGLSTQKLQYLPIQTTDFIFAVFAEEFGYVGSLMLILFLVHLRFRRAAGGPGLPQQPAPAGGHRLHHPAGGPVDPQHRRGQRLDAHHRAAAAPDQLRRQLVAEQPVRGRPADPLFAGVRRPRSGPPAAATGARPAPIG